MLNLAANALGMADVLALRFFHFGGRGSGGGGFLLALLGLVVLGVIIWALTRVGKSTT